MAYQNKSTSEYSPPKSPSSQTRSSDDSDSGENSSSNTKFVSFRPIANPSVTYESDSDDNCSSFRTPGRKKTAFPPNRRDQHHKHDAPKNHSKPRTCSNKESQSESKNYNTKTTSKPSSHRNNGDDTSSRRSSKSSGTLSFIKDIKEMTYLENFKEIHKGDTAYDNLFTYVLNSCGPNPRKVYIHHIYAVKWSLVKTLANPKPFTDKVLLFFKTSPDSVANLAKHQNGCIAFYDRIARAFAVKPEDVDRPFRQVILLCSVALGHAKESEHGYKSWSQKGTQIPKVYNSIKAIGRCTPNGDSRKSGNTLIPCGKTNVSRHNHALQYSEYIIDEIGRVKVKYAVDVEIKP